MISIERKRRINPLLTRVVIASVCFHLVLGVIAGVVRVATYVMQEETSFDAPPAVAEEPPPREVKVVIQKHAPKEMPASQLRMRPVANIAVSEVAIELPDMGDSFTVSAGLGGIGGGSLLSRTRGRMNLGFTDISVFGLRSRAERVLFVVDGSRDMVTDNKGGLYSYRVIKNEITGMVGKLSAGCLFNVVVHDRRHSKFFRPSLVPAGAEITQELEGWFAPVNDSIDSLGVNGATIRGLGSYPLDLAAGQTAEAVAMKSGSTMLSDAYVQWCLDNSGGDSIMYLTQLMMEQHVDTVFWITGNAPSIRTVPRPTSKVNKEAVRKRLLSDPEYVKQKQLHEAEIVEMRQRIAAELKAVDQVRAKKGLPPKVLSGNVYRQATEMGLVWRTQRPKGGGQARRDVELERVKSYFDDIKGRGGQSTGINVVLFLAGDETIKERDEAGLKDYVRFFDGKHRIIRGRNEITAAATAGG